MCIGYAVKKKKKMSGVEPRAPGRFNLLCCASRYIIPVVTESPEKNSVILENACSQPLIVSFQCVGIGAVLLYQAYTQAGLLLLAARPLHSIEA